MKLGMQVAVAGVLAMLAVTGGGAIAAQAATDDDPVLTWDSTTRTAEYGEYWSLSATLTNTLNQYGPWNVSGTLGGSPSGYAASYSSYSPLPDTVYGFMNPAESGRPLPAGTYTATMTMAGTGSLVGPAGTPYTTTSPATLTITPAALTVVLTVSADPSNASNAIVSGTLTGAFRDNFYTTSFAEGPLTPAGTWRLEVTDENGDVVHEVDVDRADTDDILGVSSYWSGVAPGTYTVRATFTPAGASSTNFTITQAGPVTYTAAPAPGATSTAAPAPPAPPPSPEASGMTLPGWIPLVAGVLSAGLLALLVVQIVRLRRSGPVAPNHIEEGSGA